MKPSKQGEDIDWANAEALAFASLAGRGAYRAPFRPGLSRRGTFSQRHAALFDTWRPAKPSCSPAKSRCRGRAFFDCYNSMLSEAAVLGFEYGYAIESPYGLVIWEAQFGDFVNGAQVIIDQFIVSSGSKWDRMCGLVMFLPHGYEGQGCGAFQCAHRAFSSACAPTRIYRFVIRRRPRSSFHLLRRQLKQPFRRPLVVFTPKSLLRHPVCRSSLDELSSGRFREVFEDQSVDPKDVSRVLVCSGKIFFELQEHRDELEREDVAILRIEQLYPLRFDLLEDALKPYKKAKDIFWVQEEPANNGAWFFMAPHLARILGRDVSYIGRPEAAAPASGSHRLFKQQQEELLKQAFGS
jgi:2-oxoglutarate dehydrogenase E1 component